MPATSRGCRRARRRRGVHPAKASSTSARAAPCRRTERPCGSAVMSRTVASGAASAVTPAAISARSSRRQSLEAADVEDQREAAADAGVHEVADVADDEPGVGDAVATDGDVDGLPHVVDADGVPAALDEALGALAGAAPEIEGPPELATGARASSASSRTSKEAPAPAAGLLPRGDAPPVGGGVADAHVQFLTCGPASAACSRQYSRPAPRAGARRLPAIDIL